MKDKKRNYIKLLFPPIWLTVVLTVISAVSLIAVFVKRWEETPIAYVIYVLSFYTLIVVSIACATVFPGYYKKIKNKIYSNQFGNRYMTDPVFKTHINLYRSLFFNLLYAALNLFFGIYFSTAWFTLFAAYYTIMAVMRFLLLRYVHKEGIGKNYLKELKRSELCAYILMTVNISLSGAVLMMVYFDRGFEYYGFLIYVVAMYTFYITTAAIVGMFKYRKYKSPVMSMTKIINLASALMSMLALETAMFSQFGGETSPQVRRLMIILTGAGISIIVLTISIYTIRRSRNILKRSKNNGEL